jgi:hypothetical protein
MLIAGATLLGVAGLMAIFVLVMFCNFRARIKKGGYANMPYVPQPISNQPAYGNPIVVYSDQYNQPQ